MSEVKNTVEGGAITSGEKNTTLLLLLRRSLRHARRFLAGVVVGDALAGCGPQDVVDPEDHLGSLRGRKDDLTLASQRLGDAQGGHVADATAFHVWKKNENRGI